jgi:sugar/nucleoside kinase (ribokinase family)
MARLFLDTSEPIEHACLSRFAVNDHIDIVCIGNIVADCVSRTVTRMPQPGRAVYVENIGLYGGGSAPNAGYPLARYGFRVVIVGRVGQDAIGDFLIGESVRHGCDPRYIIRDERVGSAAAQVIVDASGERSFIAALGATANFVPEDVPLEELHTRGARVLHSAGFFATTGMEGTDGSPLARVFQHASQLGMLTSLDCAWDDTDRWWRIHKVLQYTDVFCPSLADAQGITGLKTNDLQAIAGRLFELGVRRMVAITMGPAGSFVMSHTGEHHLVPTLEVEAVDGTGAGDAFIAGLLAAHLRGMSLLESARVGNVAGAVCVQAIGGTGQILSWEHLLELAKQLG